ncbi:hypothetical protein XBO1_2650002 [Xenorhabdus bovienii str. oregonense]|uniref:Uncharacterized protein n=1 Tax=Xenorhabdus bovienii str. oregonense TaxID=1398202 RepID=A0A077P864_XENBV|nr:hypothetical protein [Xenorhabdus bovienii]CDH07320.1 hypothetical protein XBO1_2650002 [Xenorhabdus bovienii str. oregonense]
MATCSGVCSFTAHSELTKFSNIIISDDFYSISFDFEYDDYSVSGKSYVVSLRQVKGKTSLYKGEAIERKTQDEIKLSARVLRDNEEGLMLISCLDWEEKGSSYVWSVDITLDD